jgi:hypothetical protein
MKMLKIFLPLLCAVVALPVVIAQSKSHVHKGPASMAKTVYVCEHCNMAATKPGKCPKCSMPTKAMKASVKCEKCPKGKDKDVAVTYQCMGCKATSAKSGTCTKCKKPMTKKTIPLG